MVTVFAHFVSGYTSPVPATDRQYSILREWALWQMGWEAERREAHERSRLAVRRR